MKLRIKFKKYGPVRFIGHLDVMRFFQKAIRRAGLDVKYTGGFSPHQAMTFAAPLGVGIESNGEYMDIEVNSMTSSQDIIDRLNRASVYGIEIVSAKVLPDNAGNAMASVAAAAYTVRFREEYEPETDIAKILPAFLARKEILIAKETKKGVREVDLRPGIFELSYEDGCFYMLLNASSAGNIKPAQVIAALMNNEAAHHNEALHHNEAPQHNEAEHIDAMQNIIRITREDVYTDMGQKFVSLGEIGENVTN